MPFWSAILFVLLVGGVTAFVAYRMLFRNLDDFMRSLRLNTQSGLVTLYFRETGEAGDAIKRMLMWWFWIIHNMVIATVLVVIVQGSLETKQHAEAKKDAPLNTTAR